MWGTKMISDADLGLREIDEGYMRLALAGAREALGHGDVPIGAIIVMGGEVIARAFNEKEARLDALAHAEMLAIRSAQAHLGDWRLTGATLYSTIEPCIMCMGAILHTRIDRLVFGAPDLKWGGCGTICDLSDNPRLNHHVAVTRGILEEETRSLLSEFFREIRRGAAP